MLLEAPRLCTKGMQTLWASYARMILASAPISVNSLSREDQGLRVLARSSCGVSKRS